MARKVVIPSDEADIKGHKDLNNGIDLLRQAAHQLSEAGLQIADPLMAEACHRAYRLISAVANGLEIGDNYGTEGQAQEFDFANKKINDRERPKS